MQIYQSYIFFFIFQFILHTESLVTKRAIFVVLCSALKGANNVRRFDCNHHVIMSHKRHLFSNFIKKHTTAYI